MKLAALVMCMVVAAPAFASEEEIHSWKAVTITAPTQLFGDVEVTATADANAHVESLAIKTKGAAITPPAKWLATLPKMRLATIQIRSEVGYDPKPWLYVVFECELPSKAMKRRTVHIAIHDGKLDRATITTVDTTDKTTNQDIKP